MNSQPISVMDASEAVAYVAYRVNEICVLYPITPATTMGEYVDLWASQGIRNFEGIVPEVVEMQSEGGAIGALHGAVQTGALATTFTSSQGLLLMIPDMFHIAAELSPAVIHVASRAVACQGMVIYAEHSDVMATRGTGFALLCSNTVQEAHDFALIAQSTSLKTRIPFLHFFDGFRTSHEVSKIERLTDEQIAHMIDKETVYAHRARRLYSEAPVTRGVILSADTYFQSRESVNPFYLKTPDVLEEEFRRFKVLTGREYHAIEYFGAPDAERIIILMGSGAETVQETVQYLNKTGEKLGLIKVHLFQPFPEANLLKCIPATCKTIAILDRTKEPGGGGEPLYQKVSTALMNAYSAQQLPCPQLPRVIGGRFGLAGKEFTPAMVKTIFDELNAPVLHNNFTIGIDDDLTHHHLTVSTNFDIEPAEVIRAIFYGLGADGTITATKNTCKIIGEQTDYFVQAYFAFDARKTGSRTISHLRISPEPIHSTYRIQQANFIACHQFQFLKNLDLLSYAAKNAIFLLNSPYPAHEVWEHLPRTIQKKIIDREIQFYVIDAQLIAKNFDLGPIVSGIMQACFFKLSQLLPMDEALQKIKAFIQKTFARKGDKMIEQNLAAIYQALEKLERVSVPSKATSTFDLTLPVTDTAPATAHQTIGKVLIDEGDTFAVSQVSNDGTCPPHTARFEKRDASSVLPVWDPEKCIQCGRCSFYCPHAAIRAKTVSTASLEDFTPSLPAAPIRGQKTGELTSYLLHVYPDACLGCGLCVKACPVKDKALQMMPKTSRLKQAQQQTIHFETVPYSSLEQADKQSVSGLQYVQPLFEFSSACAGCGETPYVKLLSQLFGHRAIIANACGCSSVFGSHLPTSPWALNAKGQGSAWSSSLFEDNAEFGFGFLLSEENLRKAAIELVQALSTEIGEDLAKALLVASQKNDSEIEAQRDRIQELKKRLTQKIAEAEGLDSRFRGNDNEKGCHPCESRDLAETQEDSRFRGNDSGRGNDSIGGNDSEPENDSKGITDCFKQLLSIADFLAKHSIWAIGGDGWAYDIGFGGLDHVLASGRKINVLVLDTEVYSNTGGQASKGTSRGAVAKFASHGKSTAKKDLGLMIMPYGNVYIAQIAMGANPKQAIQALIEAEAYEGPSLIIAYCPCIAHGIDMQKGGEQQQLAVKSGYWPLYRYNPNLIKQGKNPLQLDSDPPSIPLREYTKNENRFRILAAQDPLEFERLMKLAQEDVDHRWKHYTHMVKAYEP